jgi:ubiquinone/menaquinone biosynthesis C-methylase UbiE
VGNRETRDFYLKMAQYDDFAEQYRRTKVSPIRQHVEEHTLKGLLGNVSGLDVLDLGCGDGHYCRQLLKAGANSVLGVDVSAEMIKLAEQTTRSRRASYAKANALSLELGRRFPLALASYLLHYACDADELAGICKRISAHLEPGGRLVSLVEHPEQAVPSHHGYAMYGFSKEFVGERRDAAPIRYSMISGREVFHFDVHYFSKATYEHVLSSAGFADIEWHELGVADAGIEALGQDYWQEYLEHPPVIGLTCHV